MLAGRAALQRRLESVVAAAREGRAGTVLVQGEPGIGKTSLLDALPASTEVARVRSRGIESERGVALAGLVDLLRPLRQYCADLPAAVQELLDDLLAGTAPDGSGRSRFALGAAVLTTLAGAAERVPLLVVVDDLQWWDRPSAEALLFAVRRLPADRVATVLAARSGTDLPAAVDGIEVLDVPPVGVDDAAALLADRCAAGVATALFEAVGGNPLALIEAAGALTEAQRRGTAALPRPLPVPSSLRAGFAARIDALPEPTRLAVAAVAVLGDDRHAVRTTVLTALGTTSAALVPAEEAGLLTLGAPVCWRHPLVVAAALDSAPAATLRAVHRAAAEKLPDGSPERAWHLAQGADGPDEQAAHALIDAGRDAAARAAFADAAAAYERAAQLSVRPRPDLLETAAEHAWRSGDTDTTVRLCDEVSRHRGPHPRALALRGRVEHLGGRAVDAVALLREAASHWQGTQPAAAVDALADSFVAALLTGEADLLDRIADELGDLADRGDPVQRMLADYTRGVSLLYRHDPAGQAWVGAAAHQLVDGLAEQDPGRFAFYLITAGGWLERPDLGAETIAACIARLRKHGDLAALPKLVKIRAVHALCIGEWDSAYVDALDALDLARLTDQMAQGAEGLLVLAEIEAARGSEDSAREHLEEARLLIERHGIGWWRPALVRVEALLLLATGDVRAAAAALESVCDVAVGRGILGSGSGLLPDLVEALVRSGDTREARRRAEDFAAATADTDDPLVSALRARALALTAERPAAATELYELAVTQHEKARDSFAAARTRLLFGRYLRRAGRRSDAREHLVAAAETFAHLRAEPWHRQAQEELAALGVRRRRAEPAPAQNLTAQEFRVARLVAQGWTNKQVAAELIVSVKTVEFHLSRIYLKLGLRTRTELARHMLSGAPADNGPERT